MVRSGREGDITPAMRGSTYNYSFKGSVDTLKVIKILLLMLT